MISKRCLVCKEILHDSRATEMHSSELKALKVYLIFIDIFLIGTNHGCQFSINVVAAHTLNISRILKFNMSNSHLLYFSFRYILIYLLNVNILFFKNSFKSQM